jgi:hypothetical protein
MWVNLLAYNKNTYKNAYKYILSITTNRLHPTQSQLKIIIYKLVNYYYNKKVSENLSL